MRAYSKSQKTIWDNYAVMESARLEGMEKGIVIGMNRAGVSIEKISEATGLSIDKIKKILEENR
jgi:predicted transposase YdaD